MKKTLDQQLAQLDKEIKQLQKEIKQLETNNTPASYKPKKKKTTQKIIASLPTLPEPL
jgi:phage shock protein A